MAYSGEDKKAYQKAWLQNRKSRGYQILGGACRSCGATTDLEIDHINPESKNLYLRGRAGNAFWSRSWAFIETELKKCQLLCDTCHNTKSQKEAMKDTHGITKYHKGCRCVECKLAKRIANSKRYA